MLAGAPRGQDNNTDIIDGLFNIALWLLYHVMKYSMIKATYTCLQYTCFYGLTSRYKLKEIVDK